MGFQSTNKTSDKYEKRDLNFARGNRILFRNINLWNLLVLF